LRQVLTILGYVLPQDADSFSVYAHALNDIANDATGQWMQLPDGLWAFFDES